MHRLQVPLLGALVAALTPLGLAAQSAKIGYKIGDSIPGVGMVEFVFSNMAATDSGQWLSEADLDLPGDVDHVIFRNGIITLQEGAFLLDPPGATLSGFDQIIANTKGDLAMAVSLNDTPNGAKDDRALFWNTVRVAGEGASGVPSVGVPASMDPATFYKKFEEVRMNDRNQILCKLVVDTPDVGGTSDDGLFLFEVDDFGQLVDAQVLALEGDIAVEGTDPIKKISTSGHSIALSNNGDYAFQIQDDGDKDFDEMIILNDTIIAREGFESPVEGRTYRTVITPELDINDFGEYVFNAALDSDFQPQDCTDCALIVKNGEKFVQGDDFIESLNAQVAQFGSAPVYISNGGDIYWATTTRGPASQNAAYMRNMDVIIQTGVTEVEGNLVTGVRTAPNAFHVSPSGRFWVGEIDLQNAGEAFVVADFGAATKIPGCLGNQGVLAVTDGVPVGGSILELSLDNAQDVGVTPYLWVSTAPAIEGSECGTNIGVGELLVKLGPSKIFLQQNPPYSGVPSKMTFVMNPDPILINQGLLPAGRLRGRLPAVPERGLPAHQRPADRDRRALGAAPPDRPRSRGAPGASAPGALLRRTRRPASALLEERRQVVRQRALDDDAPRAPGGAPREPVVMEGVALRSPGARDRRRSAHPRRAAGRRPRRRRRACPPRAGGRWPRGAPGSGAGVRCGAGTPAARAARCGAPRARWSAKAGRPATTAIFRCTRLCRAGPSARSMVPSSASGTPLTTARYSFSTCRRSNCSISLRWAARVLPHRTMPLVSRSSR